MAKTSVAVVDSPRGSEIEKEHQVLYRKFRPRQFADVVGQDHIIKPLQGKVAEHKVGHAYLFVGPRGCGKTTTARLLAAASNCPNISPAGEPCGECATCNGIISGSGAIGLHELDAASNRGVGDMLDLINTMGQGSVARKKVYIIDEAHMLTKEASNALLKTLEEPPADTLIILATTEANKVLPTIQSRAVRYNFKLIDPDTMTGLIKEVVNAIGMQIDDEGIAEVVRRGHGSPRDTLTALEGYGGEEAGKDVRSFVPNIASALATRNSADLIVSIAEAINDGVDVPDLTSALLEHWRNCLLALEAPKALNLDAKTVSSLAKQAKEMKPNRVVRLLNVTAEALGKMAVSGDARLLLETTLLQISQPTASDSLDGVYDRLDDVQDTMDDLIKLVKKIGTSTSSSANDWPPAETPEKIAVKAAPVVREEEPAPAVEEEENDLPEADAPEADKTPEAPEAPEAPDEADEADAQDDDSDRDETDAYDARDDNDDDRDDEPSDDGGDDPNVQDYDQWDDELSEDKESEDNDADSGDESDEGDEEDDEPVRNISELYADDNKSDDDEEDSGRRKYDDDEPDHNHEESEASGFLDCPHPDCVAKVALMDKSEKSGSAKSKKPAKDEKPEKKKFFEEDDAPTARDLVEAIQYELIEKKYSRYLQDSVLKAEIEEEGKKAYLVLTLRKDSRRVPTDDAIDAIIACGKHLWVDEVEYVEP
jgi:DNA polymerase-3 subunit gamma/tau